MLMQEVLAANLFPFFLQVYNANKKNNQSNQLCENTREEEDNY